MKNQPHMQSESRFVWSKRPFLLTLLIIILCGSWFGLIAADGPPVIEPDVAAPPAATEQPPTESQQTVAPKQVVMGEELVFLPMIITPGGCALNSEEQVIAASAMNHPDQGRANMLCDPTLAQVARDKAQDMAERDYFGHTDPDGIGPNFKVRTAGYDLPTWYSSSIDGNNIESIAAGFPTAESAWDAWLNSSGHRAHVLAESSFWADQTNYGIGYYFDPNSYYQHYWVFISAPPE